MITEDQACFGGVTPALPGAMLMRMASKHGKQPF
jgi:hypothetical protein